MKKWGVPRLGQEFRAGDLSPALLGTQYSSEAAKLKPSCLPHTLQPVSLYLPLIGFNERFNNTALHDQIKLLPRLILGHCLVMLACPTTGLSTRFLQRPCCLTHSLPPLPPACLFHLMSDSANPDQAEKPPNQKLPRNLSRSVVYGEGCS